MIKIENSKTGCDHRREVSMNTNYKPEGSLSFNFVKHITKGFCAGLEVHDSLHFVDEPNLSAIEKFNQWVVGVNRNHDNNKCDFFVTLT